MKCSRQFHLRRSRQEKGDGAWKENVFLPRSRRALAFAFGDDGFGGVFAGLELRPFCLFFVLGLVLADRRILVAWKDRTAFDRWAIRRADLYQLGLSRDGDGDVRLDFDLIAARIGTSVLLAQVGKQQLVMAGAFGAIDTASGSGNELRIALVEGSEFEDEKNIRLNPEMQTANGKQDMFRLLASRAPILFEASRECLFLLGWLEFRQQQGMADADLLAVERNHEGLR